MIAATMAQRIRNQIERLRGWYEGVEMDSSVQRSIDAAEEWLANGGLCRYANEDFDVLQRLTLYTKSSS